MVVLTPMHDKVKVMKDEIWRPQVHNFYDHTKGGVDVVNLISCHMSTRMKTIQWPMNCVAFILNTARPNTNSILPDNNVKMTSHEFTYINLHSHFVRDQNIRFSNARQNVRYYQYLLDILKIHQTSFQHVWVLEFKCP